MTKKLIIGAAVGNCVHVAGIIHFLELAEKEGYSIKFLGPAVSVQQLFQNIELYKPDSVAIGYRLTPQNVIKILDEIDQRRQLLKFKVKWIFGGTRLVADIAKKYKFFDYISDGYDEINDVLRYLRGINNKNNKNLYSQNLLDRVKNNAPYPLIRHHFGRPNLEETIKGVKIIAESKVLDVISLGPDQNAQEYFFHPKNMKDDFDGAGGVPIRKEEDLISLKKASQCGNYPLVRCYSGTQDLLQYGKMLKNTINNAWAAIPLSWYNELDGRSSRKIEESMKEAFDVIRWHAENNIPVEINEPHHWGLRDAHDVIPVVMAYISAYNAKKLGVKHYISQYMFNNPNGLSFSMDLAKVLAMNELVNTLEDDDFMIFRETRAGLPLFHPDVHIAKGQLAASIFMQMMLKPHILHVVGFCEADHAAKAEEVIESCKIAKGVIKHTLNDIKNLDLTKNKEILSRKTELILEARELLNFIKNEYQKYEDPLGNFNVLTDCIRKGYIDAVHIVKNHKFTGTLRTKIINGKCVAVDSNDVQISEYIRLKELKNRNS